MKVLKLVRFTLTALYIYAVYRANIDNGTIISVALGLLSIVIFWKVISLPYSIVIAPFAALSLILVTAPNSHIVYNEKGEYQTVIMGGYCINGKPWHGIKRVKGGVCGDYHTGVEIAFNYIKSI